ncbi:NRPS protein biosynthetic cluster [Salix suchowensis]|nr:NRPS protein biosynthetic cluster [Salix suchowensis]
MIDSVNSETALGQIFCLQKAKSRRVSRSHGGFPPCVFHRGGLLATTSMYIQTEPGFANSYRPLSAFGNGTPELDMRRPCHTLTSASITCNIVLTPFSAVAWPSVRHQRLCRQIVSNGEYIEEQRWYSDTSPNTWPQLCVSPEVTTSLLQELKDAQESSESWYFLDPLNDLEPSPPQATKQLVSGLQLPDTFIVKCSHQSQGRNKEEEVFRSVQGFVGIPDILAGYDATLRFRIPLEHIPAEWNIMQQDEDDYDG